VIRWLADPPSGVGHKDNQNPTCRGVTSRTMCASNPRTDGQPWEPWEGNGPCQDCGRRNVCWYAPNEVWNRVMGNEAGLLCPSCFVVRALGAGLDVVWRIDLDEQTRAES
jgi:hypothetical protein